MAEDCSRSPRQPFLCFDALWQFIADFVFLPWLPYLFATSSEGCSSSPIWRPHIGKREDPGDEIAHLFISHISYTPFLSVRAGCRVTVLRWAFARKSLLNYSSLTGSYYVYVFNKRLPMTCSVGDLESFQNKLQGNCFHFYQICECKNFLELDFLWAFCQQFLTVKFLNDSSNNFPWHVCGQYLLHFTWR